MRDIKVLDKSVSNKIAAGEVVERPASVVKELLENALDAGATHIVTEIKNGGITYIRVADNGHGIPREQVPTALLRHATSKIQAEEDLDAILTLGFRGEALSSIAAVSRMEIYTKTAEEETGTYLSSIDGEVEECREAGCPGGTTVIVRDLFSNTPARMKFLKKNFTEAGYIQDIINRLALARADVSFRLIADGKELLFTAGDSDLLNCIYAVYGKDLKTAMRPAEFEEAGIRVRGYCATATGARPNRSLESFFVNGRYIKSPLLARATEEAYKNELMSGKFPACVLLVSLPPELVDINVHPTKLEAKFADEKAVYHSVYWAVKNALYQKEEIPAVTLDAPKESAEQEAPHRAPQGEIYRPAKPVLSRSYVMQEMPASKPKPTFTFAEVEANAKEQLRVFEAPKNPLETHEELTPSSYTEDECPTPEFSENKSTTTETQPLEQHVEKREAEQPTPPEKSLPPYRVCGQIFDTYIIVEQDNQMMLVDQHAAHERLRYEELLRQFETRQIVSQQLLIPVSIRLTSVEESLFSEYQPMLLELGFDAELFGDKTVLLRGAPEALDEEGLRDLFIKVLENLGEQKKDARTQKAQRALYTVACKSAVKAGNKLSEPEIRALLDAVFRLGPINTCPHGRPITVAMTRSFLEKQFKRIV